MTKAQRRVLEALAWAGRERILVLSPSGLWSVQRVTASLVMKVSDETAASLIDTPWVEERSPGVSWVITPAGRAALTPSNVGRAQ